MGRQKLVCSIPQQFKGRVLSLGVLSWWEKRGGGSKLGLNPVDKLPPVLGTASHNSDGDMLGKFYILQEMDSMLYWFMALWYNIIIIIYSINCHTLSGCDPVHLFPWCCDMWWLITVLSLGRGTISSTQPVLHQGTSKHENCISTTRLNSKKM